MKSVQNLVGLRLAEAVSVALNAGLKVSIDDSSNIPQVLTEVVEMNRVILTVENQVVVKAVLR